ncbi:hypothetical protein ACQEVG_15555 [Streptomyces sp. CA-135486]|uniref:hypothetical protein n=1 Tax=Streptomyces sp. CA-135486 TaxID=3240049 RepID=UPI003D93A020
MRAICVASLALGTAALAFGASAALADDGNNTTSFGVTVSPGAVAPGGTAGSGSHTGAGPSTAGSGSHTGADPSTGGDSDPAAEGEIGSDTGAWPSTSTDSGTEAGLGSDTGLMRPDAGVSPETGTGYDAEAGLGTGTGSDAGPGVGSSAGHGMRKPAGGVKGGTGGSFAELSPTQLGIGSTLIAGALGGGFLLLRRRAGGDA